MANLRLSTQPEATGVARGTFDERERMTFIGRADELGQIRTLLSNAVAGRGSAVFVVGEPGIGKTRMGQEASRIAVGLGCKVKRGHCYAAEGALPYRPWIEILRQLTDDIREVRAGLDSATAADILRLVPELAAALETADLIPDNPGSRVRLMDSVVNALIAVARQKPILLIVEDLHWADAPSVELFQHLLRRLESAPLFVIGTYRETAIGDGHPLQSALVEAAEKRRASWLHLGGLSRDDVREIVAERTGQPAVAIAGEFVTELHRYTDGNPFFIDQVLRHFAETGQVFEPNGRLRNGINPFATLRMPDELRRVLAARLQSLDEFDRGVLQAAAVLGRTFDFAVLLRMTGLPENAVLAAIDAGVSAHLLHERGEAGTFTFQHALIQRALADELRGPRRQRMHLGAAEAIEAVHGPDPRDHVRALAFHHREAGPVSTAENIAHYAILAIKADEDAYAWDAMARQFEVTLETLEALPVSELSRARFISSAIRTRFNVPVFSFERLRELTHWAGDVLVAAGHFEGASSMRQAEGQTYQSSSFRALQNFGKALELFEEAESLTQEPAVIEGLRLGKPNVLFQVGRCDEADNIAVEFLQSSSPALRCWALTYHAFYSIHLGNIEEGETTFDQAWEASRTHSLGTGTAGAALLWHAICYFWWLRAPARIPQFQSREAALTRMSEFSARSQQISRLAAIRESGGQPKEDPRAFARMGGDHAQIEVNLWLFRDGHWDDALAGLKQQHFDLLDRTGLQLLAGSGFRAGECLRAAGSLEEAEPFLNECFLTPWPANNLAGHAALGLLCAEAGRMEEASAHLAKCDEILNGEDWLGLGARVELLRALVRQASGESTEAESAFEDAIRGMRRVEHPWDESEAHLLFGKVLAEMGETASATEHLRESWAILQRIEAGTPFFDRVVAVLPGVAFGREPASNGSPVRQPREEGGLSPREVEVLQLLVRGLSNRRIAAALVISEPTVATHVRHVLEKTGSANRAEAAAFAVRNGLDNDTNHPIG